MTANQMATEMMAMQVPQDRVLYEIVSGAYNGSQLRGAELGERIKKGIFAYWAPGKKANCSALVRRMVEQADWTKIAERICG